MLWIRRFYLLIGTFSLAITATPARSESTDPYACRDEARRTTLEQATSNIDNIEGEISAARASGRTDAGIPLLRTQLACAFVTKAEVLKRSGSYEAEDFYKRAIAEDENTATLPNPVYELVYADYLRQFRGATVPLIPKAERHYVLAQAKLRDQLEAADSAIRDSANDDALARCRYPAKLSAFIGTCRNVQRGLATLYERDGLPINSWMRNTSDDVSPHVFFTTDNQFGQVNNEIGSVDDVRNYTSQAKFAESPIRLNRKLNNRELKSIARDWEQARTFNRLRLRYDDLPSVDAFVGYTYQWGSEITNYFEPQHTNDLHLTTFGIAAEKPLDLAPYADVTVGAAYRYIEREGTVEFRPSKTETINELELNAAVSRFVGPDKVTLDFTYVYQNIEPDSVTGGSEHNRNIYAATLSYLLLRPLFGVTDPYGQLYETRGLKLFGGYSHDVEQYGEVDVRADDFFIGSSLLGFTPFADDVRWFGQKPLFDLTIQPTIFTADVDDDDTQKNAQYRTNVVLQYTVFDEDRADCFVRHGTPECEPRPLADLDLDFLKIALPFSHDVGIDGGNYYNNVRIGVALNSKFTSYALGGTTFLASVGYDYQNFYEINKNLHLFSVRLSMGF